MYFMYLSNSFKIIITVERTGNSLIKWLPYQMMGRNIVFV